MPSVVRLIIATEAGSGITSKSLMMAAVAPSDRLKVKRMPMSVATAIALGSQTNWAESLVAA